MAKLHPDYPEHYFEFQPKEDGLGLVIAWSLQEFLVGIDYANSQGWELVPDDMATNKLGAEFMARVVNQEITGEFVKLTEENNAAIAAEEQAKILAEEEEKRKDEEQEEEVVKTVDFDELYSLDNNKPNRTYVDNLAKEFGIEIDRRKFKTVRAITEEFKRLFDEL